MNHGWTQMRTDKKQKWERALKTASIERKLWGLKEAEVGTFYL
jgi:hypothetical protein